VTNEYCRHPSPTGHLVGDDLVPLPEAVSADYVVWFVLSADEGADHVWEGIAAEGTSQGTMRLCAVPLFAYDLHYGDEVTVVQSAEGPMVATSKVKDSGNHTFRVWLPEVGGPTLTEVITEFGRLGCLIEGYSERLLGLSCGPGHVEVVEQSLRQAETEGRFLYERGRR
jgi:hypothetical protein